MTQGGGLVRQREAFVYPIHRESDSDTHTHTRPAPATAAVAAGGFRVADFGAHEPGVRPVPGTRPAPEKPARGRPAVTDQR